MNRTGKRKAKSRMESFDGITLSTIYEPDSGLNINMERRRTTWIDSQDNITGPRKALLSKKSILRMHYFEMKSDEGETGSEIGRLRIQVSPCGQCLVAAGILVAEILIFVGTLTPSFFMDTQGLAGLATDLGRSNTSYKQYTILDTIGSISAQVDFDSVGSSLGIGSIAALFMLTTVIVPSIQLLCLYFMWTMNLTIKGQKMLYLVIEALSAWQYLEVYIIAIGVASLQMADISAQIAAPLCKDLDDTFDTMVNLGILDRSDAKCLTVLAGVEYGMYILLFGAILLNLMNFVVNKAAVAALQDREARLRGDELDGKAQRPQSFFRNRCIKYLIFSCCCCVRYVAEDSEESSEDESETAALSSNNALSRRMGSLKGQRWGRTSQTPGGVGIYVPQEKGGLPPHWDEVESEDGEDVLLE